MKDYIERLKAENISLTKRINFLLKNEAARKVSSARCLKEVLEKCKGASWDQVIEETNLELNRQFMLLEKLSWK